MTDETKSPSPDKLAIPEAAVEAAALIQLAHFNIPTDVQELLVQGDPARSIPPRALRSALAAAIPHIPDRGYAEGIEAAAVFTNCCVCGRVIDKREQSEGGDPFGCEEEDGRWTCSWDCYDQLHPEPTPSPIEDVAEPSTQSFDDKWLGDGESVHVSASEAAPMDVAEPSEEEIDLRKKLEMSEKRYATLREAYDRERRRNQSPILGSACGDGDQAFSQAYYLVAGESPHWSPDFGVAEALVEIKDKMDGFRAALLAARRVRPSPVDEDARDGVLEELALFGEQQAEALSSMANNSGAAIYRIYARKIRALQSQRKG